MDDDGVPDDGVVGKEAGGVDDAGAAVVGVSACRLAFCIAVITDLAGRARCVPLGTKPMVISWRLCSWMEEGSPETFVPFKATGSCQVVA